MEVSGINFKNYNTDDGEYTLKFPVALGDFSVEDIPYAGGIVNGIEIDWNSAELPNVSLDALDGKNTVISTGHLMALINDMQGQINVLAEKVAYLSYF